MSSLFRNAFDKSPEKLVDSANKLKQRGEWNEAGDLLLKAALGYRDSKKQECEAANCLCDAANCFMKEDTHCAILALAAAAEIHAQLGHFNFAAGLHVNIADLALKMDRRNPVSVVQAHPAPDKSDAKREKRVTALIANRQLVASMPPRRLAIHHFRRAAEYYNSESSPGNESECVAKMAELMADTKDLKEAAAEFDKLVKMAEQHDFLTLGVKAHAFRACLCRLAAGLDPGLELMEKICPSFSGSDEFEFVRSLTDSPDAASTAQAYDRFEKFNRLDDWCKRRLATLHQSRGQPCPF